MNVLTASGVKWVFHYAPLHYLLFIVRSGALLSKRMLLNRGFAETHFRSTSRRQDVSRGFSDYVHLTVETMPPIVAAKLSKGFPHFTVRVPSEALDGVQYDLCRYNIAKSRYLKRGDSSGPVSGWSNGFYLPGLQLPVARGKKQQEALLAANFGKNMIEVLIAKVFELPWKTELIFHNPGDLEMAARFLVNCNHSMPQKMNGPEYRRDKAYARKVEAFLKRALAEPDWQGDGLEFDRV